MSTSVPASPAVNFIPAPCRQARRVQAEMRRWATICGVYAAVAVAGVVGTGAAMETDSSSVERQAEQQVKRAESQRAKSSSLRGQIQAAERELEAERAVSIQPDWSVLLALLPGVLGEEAALRKLSLQRDPAPAAGAVEAKKPAASGGEAGAADPKKAGKPPARPARGYTLKLTGIAASQGTPNAVAVALESSGVFDRVKLLETRREATGASPKTELIVFEIECRLAGGTVEGAEKKE